MKKRQIAVSVLFLITLVFGISSAQTQQTAAAAAASSGVIPFGIGSTIIDGQAYYLINFMPEVAFGNLGIGLDVNLRFNSAGKLRADYNSFSDYLRLLRYVRWAQKGDPFYIRLGALDYARLGHGSILYNYQNSSSYDLRKTGLEMDLNFDKAGFESVISDLANTGIYGARAYVRPLKFTSLEKIPVINNFEIGATYVTDHTSTANITHDPNFPNDTTKFIDGRSISIYGFDAGLPILSYHWIKSSLYFDYDKIVNYGSGQLVGIDFHFAGMGLLTVDAKYERRFNGDHYISSYFNALYEGDRFSGRAPGVFTSKADTLLKVTKNQGYYGELDIRILNTFNIIGAYQAPVGVDDQGVFHAEMNMPDVIPSIVLDGGFDRKNIGKVFALDENSLLYAEVGYKPVPYLIVSTVYQWTWALDAYGNYVTQKRIEPKISLVFHF
jgi:hypothetical protein